MNLKILIICVHPWPRPLAQTPGPDLACQDAVMESETFISSGNICISTSRRTPGPDLIFKEWVYIYGYRKLYKA